MSFVPGFKYDVFISYASDDDIYVDSVQSRWVTSFVRYFRDILQTYLGDKDLNVFHDARNLGPDQPLDELLVSVKQSAVFLAIVSRCYVSSSWATQELDTFVSAAGDPYRLAAIDILPLAEGQTYPEALKSHKRWRFYENDPTTGTPAPVSHHRDDLIYEKRVRDVAERLSKKLREMKAASEAAAIGQSEVSKAAPRTSSSDKKRVLLAQVTDDLEDEREQVLHYLDQYGIAVLPTEFYPQNAHAFVDAFASDLAKADLFVQLLGKHKGRAPSEIPQGYAQLQLSMAQKANIEILQWRRDDFNLDEVSDEQRKLLTGEFVVASGLESFKSEIVRRATVKPEPALRNSEGRFVFINADKEDVPIASLLKAEFDKSRLSTAIPSFDGDADAVRRDLEDSIVDCTALVVVYGKTSPTWVRGQLRLYNKLKSKRSGPPRVLALYIGPPPDKPDLGFSIPEFRDLDCRAAFTLDPVRALITELTA